MYPKFIGESASWAYYYIMESNQIKKNLVDYIHSEIEELYEDEIDASETKKSIKQIQQI